MTVRSDVDLYKYAYWDEFSDFDDRFGQFCMDYSKVVNH
jgi:hypothetical protein